MLITEWMNSKATKYLIWHQAHAPPSGSWQTLMHSGKYLTGGIDSTQKMQILTEIFGLERNFGEKIVKMAHF